MKTDLSIEAIKRIFWTQQLNSFLTKFLRRVSEGKVWVVAKTSLDTDRESFRGDAIKFGPIQEIYCASDNSKLFVSISTISTNKR